MAPAQTKWLGRVDLAKDGRNLLDEEGFRILEGIRRGGSIAFAAKSVGRSYAYVWRLIKTISLELGYPLIEATAGGRAYGGAALTKHAKALLDEYHTLTQLQRRTIETHGKRSGKAVDLMVTGSDCSGLRLLLELVREETGITSEVNAVGSAAGLATLMLGEADIVGFHLLDPETGQYNLPFLRRFWIDDRAVVVRGYLREQGLSVKRGNPRKILSIEDLTRQGVKFVNRQRGSGTRILLDHLLTRLSESRSVSLSNLTKTVRGYENEVRSHAEMMEQILTGKADVGLGIRPGREALDFIPIHEELFDFAIDRDKVNGQHIQAFIKMLSSMKFKQALTTRLSGIRTSSESGKIVYP